MVQKAYEITVEALVQRTVIVDADDINDAEAKAEYEVKNLVGAVSTEILEVRRLDY